MLGWFADLIPGGVYSETKSANAGGADAGSPGVGGYLGSFFGDTLSGVLKPLLPILIILLVVYVFASIAAKRIIP